MVEMHDLATAHMRQQVREVAAIQAALAELWDRTMDPGDLEGSFQRFQSGATGLIKGGRTRAESTAQAYFADAKVAAGYPRPTYLVDFQPTQTLANRNALHATSVGHAKRQIARGVDPVTATAAAKVAMLRAAKRRVLEAPRQRLTQLSKRDPDVRAWARVSDGNPCAFCAMLVARGPIYSGTDFESHDGCGCSVEAVFNNDPTRGWSPEALALKEVYENTPADVTFRAALAEARTRPGFTA